MIGVLTQPPNGRMEDPIIMRALDPEVVDTVWAAIEPLLPAHAETHPLGCYRGSILIRPHVGVADWSTPTQ